MTSQNVLQPINCNVGKSENSPLSKRPRRECSLSENPWSLSTSKNELEILEEMGLGMLDSDEFNDKSSENDNCQPSCSFAPPPPPSQPSTSNHNNNATNTYVSSGKESSRKTTSNHRKVNKKTKQNNWDGFSLNKRSSIMNPYTKDWFNCLSDEIILMVFRWLPKVSLTRCALVCKRWHRLSSDESLWTRLDCSQKLLEPGSLGHILSRQVIILKLSQTEILDPPILPGVKSYSDQFQSKLLYLDLSMATVSSSCLVDLFKKCTRLRKLSLESCIIDYAVCLELSRNEYLEVLNLTMVEGLTGEGAEFILSNCQKIKELNLSWTCLSADALTLICSALPSNLIRLNLSGCRKTLNMLHVKDIVEYCPHLRELDLSDGTGLTNDTIKFITMLKELNFLALSRCYGIHCSSLKKLACMSSLQYLDVHGGHIEQRELDDLQQVLGNRVQLNKFMFSSIARPTVGMKRSSIWGLRVRD